MAQESSSLATAKTILSTVASVAATGMVVRSVIRDYVSDELLHSLFLRLLKFFSGCGNDVTMVIDEFDGLVSNEIYSAAECHLGPKISPATGRFKISKTEKEKDIKMSMEKGEVILDVYNGQKLKWVCVVKNTVPTTKHFSSPRDIHSAQRSEVRSLELSFHKKNMNMVISYYLPHIIQEAQLKKRQMKTVKIHTVDYDEFFEPGDVWKSVNLDHPATFDTLAMDADKKDMIVKDLEMFVKRRDYYRRVGKAWKRGYLLYGPPGTGKSSLIAAMANFLNFDIYDLELTAIRRNSDLKKLLMATANKSILVVEDIDCTIDLENRMNKKSAADTDFHQNKVTLSGFLNFIDGLWSSCGDERIIIFTTNHIENLDPALLRPGRMDVHIHMSYCTPSGFEVLAKSYLSLEEHFLFKDIGELIRTTKVTPAEVAEQLLKQNQNKPDASLQALMEFLLDSKRKRTEEALQQVDDDEKVETDIEAVAEIKQVHVEKNENVGDKQQAESEASLQGLMELFPQESNRKQTEEALKAG